ncbi:clustered mitochondria protein homolog [Dreissena polymorpha]|uniref:clustered mitochondria protein homolog n=1 Tax=Dreissena polymorpha TaxID=45954 RepID=UPI00226457D9|nr:clustered mitochondria protein homolog [Dreissena polymorpha]
MTTKSSQHFHDISEVKKVVTGEDKDGKDSLETDEAKKIVKALTGNENQTIEESSRDIVKKAAIAMGSLSDTEFNVTFNPDVYQSHVNTLTPRVS